ncbi:MAG: redox-sensing transcriptional repressor Rex [Clostridiales bacterium]|nr:redox-sensing transcriptional repressor Rex [Clostridiales bacterium]MDD7310482.1 redox-sensing transcriptional repressor Rex [Eubacteriales bacterium]MDY5347814.1 redox-sensing transcriptional repressor Rex [Eubacteriales bacterium]
MSRHGFISMAVIRRLPRYYRYLHEMYLSGMKQISSRELADCMELTASQVRQDFNCFGDFGQQGCGYDVEHLHREITKILGLDQNYGLVLVGAGRIGQSLLENFGFEKRGFQLMAAFDNDPAVIGQTINGVTVSDAAQADQVLAGKPKPDIGILAVPTESAAAGAELLKKCGVKAIWNFTKGDLARYEASTLIQNVHLSDSLITLCYRLTELENKIYDAR